MLLLIRNWGQVPDLARHGLATATSAATMAPRDQAKQTIQGPVRQGPISKDGGPRCGSPRSSTDTVDYLLILLANMTLWKALGRLMAPFMKIISMYWYLCGAARKVKVSMGITLWCLLASQPWPQPTEVGRSNSLSCKIEISAPSRHVCVTRFPS